MDDRLLTKTRLLRAHFLPSTAALRLTSLSTHTSPSAYTNVTTKHDYSRCTRCKAQRMYTLPDAFPCRIPNFYVSQRGGGEEECRSEVKEEGEVGIKDDTIGEGKKATDNEGGRKSALSSAVEDSQSELEDAVMHDVQGGIYPAVSTQSNASSSSNTPLPSASTSSLPNTNSSALKPRFKSTFRGRTIQGLTVDLPQGYTGVILHSTDDDAPTTKTKAGLATAKMSERLEQGGRLLRGKVKAKLTTLSSVIDVDGMEDGDDGEVGGTRNANTLGNVRMLQPTSRFSSFILWHPDIPVDEGRDEYHGALNEWVAIAHAVNRVPED
ncbi:hypothetical protein VKT23_013666 [Stygiomarasmius scandens]|uniref:Uncharacterized protein n=1 Tax=Marasmiellus scandens TaxID=2682957 RepID=A0ABR1J6X1_9AGAR